MVVVEGGAIIAATHRVSSSHGSGTGGISGNGGVSGSSDIAAGEADATAPAALAAVVGAPPRPQVFTILIVDDDATTRLFMGRSLLRALGRGTPPTTVNIVEAEDGLEALARVTATLGATPAQAPFTAICVDRHMPRLSGDATLARLRALGYTGLLVAITGDTATSDASALRAAGADAVLAKPINVAALAALMRARAGGAGGGGGSGGHAGGGTGASGRR